jgi:hypothetical protein
MRQDVADLLILAVAITQLQKGDLPSRSKKKKKHYLDANPSAFF